MTSSYPELRAKRVRGKGSSIIIVIFTSLQSVDWGGGGQGPRRLLVRPKNDDPEEGPEKEKEKKLRVVQKEFAQLWPIWRSTVFRSVLSCVKSGLSCTPPPFPNSFVEQNFIDHACWEIIASSIEQTNNVRSQEPNTCLFEA